LRASEFRVILHCGGGSFKSQMKKADASGAQFAVIIGEEEAGAKEAQLKNLRDEGAAQRRLKIDDLVETLEGWLDEAAFDDAP
ncbi:MAG: histidine--tRNA ligase, partial [Zoogloeaceae bacterium]|jgi:histidyl-tRNA synthetase|nr:histidine--tRNA ligase [Zoogloeaceae bacterium]